MTWASSYPCYTPSPHNPPRSALAFAFSRFDACGEPHRAFYTALGPEVQKRFERQRLSPLEASAPRQFCWHPSNLSSFLRLLVMPLAASSVLLLAIHLLL